jgi:eukaryotic-like serine/threonine-protein kinase
MKDRQPDRVRFGVFELDLRSGELLKGDERTLLQEQPLKVLRMLVEREGKIVIREEIKKKLWPNDTVVEFDYSINAAIKNLRRALGDSADEPKYIETLARRGYRLMVRVEWVSADNSPSPTPTLSPEAGEKGGAPTVAAALTGRTVSHYRVLNIIGGGGMGVVYSAEDLKLGRRVALKFLPEELGSEPQALERFEREAQTASSLNHPNICYIHEFGEHEGQPFIAMELLEGETLRDRLAAAAESAQKIPLDELSRIALQVVDGLEAAHEQGIIHRDIKPANIFLTKKGTAKILDFGLAKLAVASEQEQSAAACSDITEPDNDAVIPSAERSEASRDPYSHEELAGIGVPRRAAQTPGRSLGMTQRDGAPAEATLTRTGVAMGTAGYMSPEQVRGEKLDARTDIFSFGLVLYEMASGQRAFSGDTAAIVHDAILNNSPSPVHELNSALPAKLISTIDKAMEKDRGKRYQSATEMRADLEVIPSGKRPTAHRPWKSLATAALLIVVAVGGWLYWHWHNTARLTKNDTIVLADFTNSTTDPIFDNALNTALRMELEQTPFLSMLAPDKVRGTLKQMNHSGDEKLTPELGREVCLHTNSKAYLAGSIADAGNHYRVGLTAVNCQTGKTFARTDLEADNRNQVVKMLGVAGNDLRRKLGEPQASLQKFNQPLEEATTSSLEALQALSQALKMQGKKGDAEALPYLSRTVELDPNFAYAYSVLGVVYRNLAVGSRATENYTRAYELRDRASARERLYIEGEYYVSVTGKIEEAAQVYTQFSQTYPGDYAAHNNLSRCLRMLGRYEMAISEAKEALRIRPDSYAPVFNLMNSYIPLHRLDEAKEAFEEALARGVDVPHLRWARYWVAFLQSDEAAMREQIAWSIGKPEAEQYLFSAQSDAEAYYGRFAKARESSQHVLESSRLAVSREGAADWTASKALREAEVGNAVRARKAAGEALQLMLGGDQRSVPALALALAGDTTQASKLADGLNQQFPVDTLVQSCDLPTIRAAIALGERDPGKAIKNLDAARLYEMGYTAFGLLTPAYVRGLAYLMAEQGQQAAVEFRKILDHPVFMGNTVISALAHLQLGRAQAMMGDKAAARQSYQDFLTLWKDADPDIPIYKQAKAEYAKLR